jgi:tetratricopeptide (TPR) repeat protein
MGTYITKLTTAAASTEHTSIRLPRVRMAQNFLLIWLDGNIDEKTNAECQNIITKLREVVNALNTFNDVDECIKFITDIKAEKVFMISSDALGQTIVPVVHEMAQISTIYIFGQNKTRHEQLAQQWPKVKGVFTDITPICEALKEAVQECDQNTISMSFVATSDDTTNKNLNELDQSFMYTQILKEILLTIDFESEHFKEFITYCKEQFDGNPAELRNVDKLEREYHRHEPIWWYTYQCFLYSMLNRALRVMEIDLVVKLGIFIRDIHQNITRLHAEQYAGQTHSATFTVYRGQGLSQSDFDQLVKTKGGLLSFNNFLSTSKKRDVSLKFARQTMETSDLVGILFVMTIDPSVTRTSFANVRDASCFQGEEEILFSMHSVFRIKEIKNIDGNNRLWQAELTLTTDHDPQLHSLTEHIRNETFPHEKGWYRLGYLLIKLGQFVKAQQVCEVMLAQTSDELERANIYHMLGWIKDDQGEYAEAITFYEKSIEINHNILSPTHSDLAASYSNIGLVYDKMGNYLKALSSHEKTLEIYQKTLPPYHPDLATAYNNIGLVYDKMDNYLRALSYHEKAIEICQKTLPPYHPSLAICYGNIGLVYNNMGEYSKALSYHEKALAIRHKTLPSNHPSFAASYNNIGMVYEKIGEYSKALSSHEKALEIKQKTLLPNHPDFAISYNEIGLVYQSMREYSKALSYYELAVEIGQRSLPANHPRLQKWKENLENIKFKL